MKPGDLVMFNNMESKYAKWFYGHFGIIKFCSGIAYTNEEEDGYGWCRVIWLQPIKYFGDGFSTFSDFNTNNFEVYDESR